MESISVDDEHGDECDVFSHDFDGIIVCGGAQTESFNDVRYCVLPVFAGIDAARGIFGRELPNCFRCEFFEDIGGNPVNRVSAFSFAAFGGFSGTGLGWRRFERFLRVTWIVEVF